MPLKFLILLLPILSPLATGLDIQGHRGARALRPENTLPAFQRGLELGVQTLELDLTVSRDDVLMISHDPFINTERCLGSKGEVLAAKLLIRSLTAAQIQSYDCGSITNPLFPKQQKVPHTPIPRLTDLFQMLSQWPRGKIVRLNMETKIYPAHPEFSPPPQKFVELIIKELRNYDLVARTILESFDDRTLKIAKILEPKLHTALLTSDNHIDYVAAAKSVKADYVSPNYEWVLPDDVATLHRAGIKVIPWTVNDPIEAKRLIKMNVDGIITDDPEVIKAD
jgi:glycerophosphoryl diester phosphodiesterase